MDRTDRQDVLVTGRVLREDGGEAGGGIAGVAVSDGLTVARTRADGTYQLPVDRQRRLTNLVHITVPAGWRVPCRPAHIPAIFRRVDLGDGPVASVDFVLSTDPVGDHDELRFLAFTDVHVQPRTSNTGRDLGRQLARAHALAREAAPASSPPRFVIVSGDLTNDATAAEFADYVSAAALSRVPVWSAPGNHDLTLRRRGGPHPQPAFQASYRDIVDGYRQALGPEWYSFQWGRYHFVVLENYRGLAEPDQLHWLEQDLAVGATGKHVVVVAHVPWNVPQIASSALTAAYRELLGRYDVRLVVAGHTHANDVATDVIGRAVQVVSTSSVGNLDLTPRGFRLVELRDGEVEAPFVELDASSRSAALHTAPAPAAGLPYQGSPWPMFHRDGRHSGLSDDVVAPPLRLAWVYDSGGSILTSSPAVEHGTVFVGVRDENRTEANGVIAVDLATGQCRWRVAAPGAVDASVAVAGSLVFAPSVRGPLRALDAGTGAVRWEWMPDQPGAERCWMYCSPTVVDGTLYHTYNLPDGTWVVALDAASGRTRWRTKEPIGRNWATHASPAVDGDLLVFATAYSNLVALDATTGATRWQAGLGGGLQVASMPVLTDDIVLLARQADRLVAIDANSGKPRWHYDAEGDPLLPGAVTAATPAVVDRVACAAFSDGTVVAVDTETGTLRWRQSTGGAVIAAPAISGGWLYVGSNDGWLRALDRGTGDCVWSHDLGAWVTSSPAVTGNTVIAAAWNGRVYAFTAAGPAGTSGASGAVVHQ
jgi:outer membrane protein assembly factor BamB/predicted MPP superfamily phosphohydrolase